MSSDSDHNYPVNKRKKFIITDSENSDESIVVQTRRRKKIYVRIGIVKTRFEIVYKVKFPFNQVAGVIAIFMLPSLHSKSFILMLILR